jgi:nucleoside 2-deoxyribosyltransferase
MKKIYLAGPDVFLPNAKEHGEMLKKQCQEFGYEGLFPLDNEIQGNTLEEIALNIKKANIELINECDIIVANLSPFRGPEPDSGTVWEVGYAQALGKTVIGYSNDMRDLRTKTIDILNLDNEAINDKDNLEIENFGLTHNLMYADIVRTYSFEHALLLLPEHQTN